MPAFPEKKDGYEDPTEYLRTINFVVEPPDLEEPDGIGNIFFSSKETGSLPLLSTI